MLRNALSNAEGYSGFSVSSTAEYRTVSYLANR